MSSMLDIALGMGYSGYAKLGGTPLLLNSSSAVEEDHLIKSEIPVSTESSLSAGNAASRNRRKLSVNLSCALTQEALSLACRAVFKWRTDPVGTLPSLYGLEAIVANHTGYRSEMAFIEQVQITSQENQLSTISFTVTCWVWRDLNTSTPQPMNEWGFDPTSFEVIPHYLACLSLDGLGGTVTGWSCSANNNWQYRILCERYKDFPPNPTAAIVGPLDLTLQAEVLAALGARPPEISQGFAQFAIPSGLRPPVIVNFGHVLRDPSRELGGFGSPDAPVKWKTNWFLQGAVPTCENLV